MMQSQLNLAYDVNLMLHKMMQSQLNHPFGEKIAAESKLLCNFIQIFHKLMQYHA